jgi:DNA-binding NarL/FixJ family response regulator
MTIRIVIADDHAVVAEGLRSLINAQDDMEVVGLAGNGRDAVRLASGDAGGHGGHGQCDARVEWN